MRRYVTAWFVAVLGGLLAWVGSAEAQSYRFRVPEAEVTVTIEPEGSALIHYRLTFQCSPGAHAIDIVDIGMPTEKHEAVSAAVNGSALDRSAIRGSTMVENGYETHLGSHTIQPGGRGVFEFTGRSHGMVWQDTIHKEMASFRFTPTWFGSRYIQGETELALRYKLPPGSYTDPDRMIVWHKSTPPFQLKGVLEGESVPSVAWNRTIRMTGPHLFGVSFPKAFVKNVRSMSIFGLLLKWFVADAGRQVLSGMFIFVAFSLLFLVATRGTGGLLYIVLALLMVVGMVNSPVFHLWLYPLIVIGGGVAFWYCRLKKKHYIPASVSRAGGRVHSGLSAVEAAILLDKPVNHVLTMLIFELSRRGLVEITTPDPLELKVTALKDPDRKSAWRVDRRRRQVTGYEDSFLTVFIEHPGEPVHTLKLEECFKKLIECVSAKLEGCDLDKTRKYCRFKVEQAWKRVREESDFEARTRYAEKHQGWLMNDEDAGRKWEALEVSEGYYYRPSWCYCGHGVHPRPAWGYDSDGHSVPASPSGAATVAGSVDSAPAFRDVVDSISGRLEGLGDGMESLPINKTRSIDLSALDVLTGDALDSIAESSGSYQGGGYGGGCACACAGCACACACAGGGR